MGTVNSESVRRVAVISSSPMERGMIRYALVLDGHRPLDAEADSRQFLDPLRGVDIGLLVIALTPAERKLQPDLIGLLEGCRAQSVPVLVLLDHDSRALQGDMKSLGASLCLIKPFAWEEFRYWCNLLLSPLGKGSAR